MLLNYMALCTTIRSIICSLALQSFESLRKFLYPFVDIEYFYIHLWSIHEVMIFNSMNWCVWVLLVTACHCRCYPTEKCLENVSHYLILAQLPWQPEWQRVLVLPVIWCERKSLSESQFTASTVCLAASLSLSSFILTLHVYLHTT